MAQNLKKQRENFSDSKRKADEVKKSVENMTGLKVLEVNVHVQGVHAVTEKSVENEDISEE